MSVFNQFHIPESVMNLPVIRTARVYNQNGNIIDIDKVDTSAEATTPAHQIEFIRDPWHYGPIHVGQLSKEGLENLRYKNWHHAVDYYFLAKPEQTKSNLQYALAAVTGCTATVFAGHSVIKAKEILLDELPMCPTSKTQAVLMQVPCDSQNIEKAQSQVRHDFTVSMSGALILGAVTIATVLLARAKAQQASSDFVRAALALGNADTCDKALSRAADMPIQLKHN